MGDKIKIYNCLLQLLSLVTWCVNVMCFSAAYAEKKIELCVMYLCLDFFLLTLFLQLSIENGSINIMTEEVELVHIQLAKRKLEKYFSYFCKIIKK